MVQGKPTDKHRYVFTKIDKKPAFLIMGKCNFCPFVINDFEGGCARCGKFVNVNIHKTTPNYITKVYGYMQKGYGTQNMEMLTHIDIPHWCGLPNHIAKITPNDAIHTIVNGKLFIESGQNYANTVQIISDDNVMFSKEDYESLILTPEKPSIIKYSGSGGRIRSYPSTSSTDTYSDKDTKICSFCGDDKENVERDKRLGMCDDCWSKYKFSHPKRHISYINNFRLKRRENWKNEEYKKVIIN